MTLTVDEADLNKCCEIVGKGLGLFPYIFCR
jgi:hypothetical protein